MGSRNKPNSKNEDHSVEVSNLFLTVFLFLISYDTKIIPHIIFM